MPAAEMNLNNPTMCTEYSVLTEYEVAQTVLHIRFKRSPEAIHNDNLRMVMVIAIATEFVVLGHILLQAVNS